MVNNTYLCKLSYKYFYQKPDTVSFYSSVKKINYKFVTQKDDDNISFHLQHNLKAITQVGQHQEAVI